MKTSSVRYRLIGIYIALAIALFGAAALFLVVADEVKGPSFLLVVMFCFFVFFGLVMLATAVDEAGNILADKTVAQIEPLLDRERSMRLGVDQGIREEFAEQKRREQKRFAVLLVLLAAIVVYLIKSPAKNAGKP